MIQPGNKWRKHYEDYLPKVKKRRRKANTIKSIMFYIPKWLKYIEKQHGGQSDGIIFKRWCE